MDEVYLLGRTEDDMKENIKKMLSMVKGYLHGLKQLKFKMN